MSLEHHTITVGAVTKTLAEWGLTSCVVRHRLGGEDEMILTATRDVDRSPIFEAGDELLLEDPDQVNRFRGRALRLRRSAGGGSEVHTYTVVGPWQYLKEVTYLQSAKFNADPEVIAVDLVPEETARVILHRNPETAAKWNMRQQVEDALQFAKDAGAPIAFNVSGVPTTEPPEDQALDQRVADVVRRSLGWAPHIGCRWDYSTPLPVLRFGDTVDGTEFESRTVDLTEVTEWTGDERWDLLCPEFEICYIGQNQATSEDQTITWLTVHRDVSTVENGAFGRQVSTVVLRGYVWDGSQWTSPEPRPADGLAASLHKAFKQLFYELAWTVQGQEVDWTAQPGERWDVTGVTAGYEEAQSVAQEIVRDIGAGTTSIQAGPPSYLGLADRLALLVPNRIRGVSNSAGESTYGMKPPEADEEEPGYTETQVRAMVLDGTSFAPASGYIMWKPATP